MESKMESKMKRILFIFVASSAIITQLCQCKCSKTNPSLCNDEPKNLVVESPLDSNLIRQIIDLRSTMTTFELTKGIPIDSLIVKLFFNNDVQLIDFFGADSVASVGFLTKSSAKSNYKYYKGIIELSFCKVAVFDVDDVGGKFYNKSDIKYISLDSLYSPDPKMTFVSNFKIKGDTLILIGGR